MKNNVMGKVVYISGAISSDPDYKRKFERASRSIRIAGAKNCLNPATLPDNLGDYEAYMEHCLLMVRRADMLVMLPCWTASPGAQAERAYALSLRREVIDLTEI